MRTACLTGLLALSLIVTSVAKPNPLNSIRPLQMYQVQDDGTKTLVIICTAWATRYEEKPVWATAMHCAESDPSDSLSEADGWFVDGKPVQLIRGVLSDEKAIDVAIFQGGPKADPLNISFAAPTPLTPIWTSGYPFGSERQHTTAGVYSNDRDDDGYALYNLAVAPGMSGAPIVLMNGSVIGVLRRMECPTFVQWCPVSAGTSTVGLRSVLGL